MPRTGDPYPSTIQLIDNSKVILSPDLFEGISSIHLDFSDMEKEKQMKTSSDKVSPKSQQKKSYQSGDLYLAAALAACGFPQNQLPKTSALCSHGMTRLSLTLHGNTTRSG